jgi:hypothetical protein
VRSKIAEDAVFQDESAILNPAKAGFGDNGLGIDGQVVK